MDKVALGQTFLRMIFFVAYHSTDVYILCRPRGAAPSKNPLTLILLTWRIWWAPKNVSRWQMGLNSAFKGLNKQPGRKTHKTWSVLLISNFRRVLNLLCIILGVSPASDCCMPTFRNPLSVPPSRAGRKVFYIQPLKMELIEGSETSANHNRTPGKYPKEYIHDLLLWDV